MKRQILKPQHKTIEVIKLKKQESIFSKDDFYSSERNLTEYITNVIQNFNNALDRFTEISNMLKNGNFEDNIKKIESFEKVKDESVILTMIDEVVDVKKLKKSIEIVNDELEYTKIIHSKRNELIEYKNDLGKISTSEQSENSKQSKLISLYTEVERIEKVFDKYVDSYKMILKNLDNIEKDDSQFDNYVKDISF